MSLITLQHNQHYDLESKLFQKFKLGISVSIAKKINFEMFFFWLFESKMFRMDKLWMHLSIKKKLNKFKMILYTHSILNFEINLYKLWITWHKRVYRQETSAKINYEFEYNAHIIHCHCVSKKLKLFDNFGISVSIAKKKKKCKTGKIIIWTVYWRFFWCTFFFVKTCLTHSFMQESKLE